MSYFMLDTDGVTSIVDQLKTLASKFSNLASEIKYYQTSDTGEFDFTNPKNTIVNNIEACATKINNVSKLLEAVVSSHTELQNNLKSVQTNVVAPTTTTSLKAAGTGAAGTGAGGTASKTDTSKDKSKDSGSTQKRVASTGTGSSSKTKSTSSYRSTTPTYTSTVPTYTSTTPTYTSTTPTYTTSTSTSSPKIEDTSTKSDSIISTKKNTTYDTKRSSKVPSYSTTTTKEPTRTTTTTTTTSPVSTSTPTYHSGGGYSGSGGRGYYSSSVTSSEEGPVLEAASVKETTDIGDVATSIDDIIKGRKYSKIPTSSIPIETAKVGSSGSKVIPVTAGLSAAGAAGLGAKVFLDKKKEEDKEEEFDPDSTDYLDESENAEDFEIKGIDDKLEELESY